VTTPLQPVCLERSPAGIYHRLYSQKPAPSCLLLSDRRPATAGQPGGTRYGRTDRHTKKRRF
jgi:hypothetical protein